MRAEILVVEDHAQMLEAIANQFQAQGVRVLTAKTDKQAYELYCRRASSISAVVTDMRLTTGRNDDFSGAELAQNIRKLGPNLPIYCNSAIDVRHRFPVFSKYFVKGPPGISDDIFDSIDEIVGEAIKYDASRFSSVPQQLVALKSKYGIADVDFFTLVGSQRLADYERTALMLVHRISEVPNDATSSSAETGNISIEIIGEGAPESAGIPLRRPVPVVIEHTDDIWIAELFGFPLIYTYAKTKFDAVRNLLQSLLDHHSVLRIGNASVGNEETTDFLRFGAFLKLLFGEK